MSLLENDPQYIYVVEAELVPGADAEGWNRWYDEKHVPELLSVPGFMTANRFRDRDDPNRYLAAYGLDRPDPFTEERYAEVTGWQEWGDSVKGWDRAVFERRPTEF